MAEEKKSTCSAEKKGKGTPILDASMNRLTQILSMSRVQAGVTQEAMAQALGVARKTIQNWEKGLSYPDMVQTISWFHVLNVNPMSFVYNFRYPGIYGIGDDSDKKDLQRLLHNMVDSLPEESLRMLAYLYYGDHGSDSRAIMHLAMAYLQTPLKDRVNQAELVFRNYEFAKAREELSSANGLQPDMEFLKHAHSKAVEAVMNEKSVYGVYMHHDEE